MSRTSLKFRRTLAGRESQIGAVGASRKARGAAAIRKIIANTGVTGKPVMISLNELATAFPSRKVPAMLVRHLATKKVAINTGLVIDVQDLPGVATEPRGLDNLLSDNEMLDLDQVIQLTRAAGRSSVHAMESANRIFGLLPPGRVRGKRYPKWQFFPPIAGEPLQRILSKLESVDGWAKYQFFYSTFPDLGNLTPLELLTTHLNGRAMTDETRALTLATFDKRLALVEECAEGFANPP